MNEKIVIVVPCFNEASRLHPNSFCDALSRNKYLHWLFVDDGSTDQTPAIIQSMSTQFPTKILFHQLDKNSGKGEAVRQGLLKAIQSGASLTGYYDADQAIPIPELFRLLDVFSKQKGKVLLAVRLNLLGRNISDKRWRYWARRYFSMMASWILSLKVYDTQCGMKLIANFPGLKSCLNKPFDCKWVFDVELIQRLIKVGSLKGDDFFEEPLWVCVDVKGSKLKAKDFIVGFFDLLRIKIKSIRT